MKESVVLTFSCRPGYIALSKDGMLKDETEMSPMHVTLKEGVTSQSVL